MLSNLRNRVTSLFSQSDLLKRLLYTLLIILIYRILLAIPLPGIDVSQFQQNFGQATVSDTSYIFSIFTGGSFDTPSLVGMGIAAYINASIIIQLLSSVIPSLERLSKDGEHGRELLNKYTRFLTLPLALFYGFGYVLFLRSVDSSTEIGQQITSTGIKALFANLDNSQIVLIALTLTAGTMLLMWLAELITEIGVGNGMSIFISMNIATSLPSLLIRDFSSVGMQAAWQKLLVEGDVSILTSNAFGYLYLLILGSLFIFAAITFITESTRKVPVQYARRVAGGVGIDASYLPLKLNQSGVIPVIFASSFLTMPQILIPILVNWGRGMAEGAPLKQFLVDLNNSFLLKGSTTTEYILLYLALILAFSFFYSFIIMKPSEVAENFQKSGAFIPGVRPGKSTESFLIKTMIRLTAVGALFLGAIAIAPILLGNNLVTDAGARFAIFSGLGGTSLIIVVGTALETYRQARSVVLTKNYEKFI